MRIRWPRWQVTVKLDDTLHRDLREITSVVSEGESSRRSVLASIEKGAASIGGAATAFGHAAVRIEQTAAQLDHGELMALQTKLAEYTAHREEIRNRSDFQNRIMQMHITALGLIVGAALTIESVGLLVLCIIPFEAAIMGLWWFDHAFNIENIARYVATEIENKINVQILKRPDFLHWESGYRVTGELTKEHAGNFQFSVSALFLLPGVIGGVASLVALAHVNNQAGGDSRELMGTIPDVFTAYSLCLDCVGVGLPSSEPRWIAITGFWLVAIGAMIGVWYLARLFRTRRRWVRVCANRSVSIDSVVILRLIAMVYTRWSSQPEYQRHFQTFMEEFVAEGAIPEVVMHQLKTSAASVRQWAPDLELEIRQFSDQTKSRAGLIRRNRSSVRFDERRESEGRRIEVHVELKSMDIHRPAQIERWVAHVARGQIVAFVPPTPL